MIGFKNGRISDHISKPVYEVSSSAVVIIDSSDGIDEEDKDSAISKDASDSHPPSSHENKHTAHTRINTSTM